METDVRPDDMVEHETDDSDDSEFEDALEELVLASGVEKVNISNNSNNRPAESGETTSSRSPEDIEKKMAQEIVNEVITTAKQRVATAGDRCHSTGATSATKDGSRDATADDSHSIVKTSATTDGSRDATTTDIDSASATTLLQDARSPGAALYEDIHIQADAVAADTCDNIAKEPKEDCEDEAEDARVSEENEEQRDEEDLDEEDKAEDEEREDEKFVVDEEFLKEREANLTDEEKQVKV